MGDVAASGGVWISTPADRIYAEPTTITGSIGVAVAFPTLENVFDYVGVNFDGVTTSKNAGWGINQGIDEQLDAIFARWAGSAYNRFIEQVAQSREKDTDYIRSIAGGRVWLAPKAKEIELIDELGTMEDAIAYAASQAGLEEYRVNYMVQEVSPVIAFLRRFSIGLDAASTHPYGVFGQRIAELMKALEGINQPRAAILCAECMVEVL
jgi:protease-4